METSLFRCQLVTPLEEWKEIRLKKPQPTETQKLQQGQQACFIHLRIKIYYAVEVICGRNSFYVFFFFFNLKLAIEFVTFLMAQLQQFSIDKVFSILFMLLYIVWQYYVLHIGT